MIWTVAVPIVIALVYLILGFIITKRLIKMEMVDSPADFWFYFLLWLPAFLIGGIWSFLTWLAKFPVKFAEKHLYKE